MKRILMLVLCLAAVIGVASAYGLYLDCDEEVQAGIPVKCSIESDFPAGTTFNLVFYESEYTATEVDRQQFTIQDDQATQYKLFDTKGYPGGTYKVEVQYLGADEPRLRSDSVTLQLVTIIDRQDEITITSPVTQVLEEALRIEGSIAKAGNQGVKLGVRGPDGRVFGPDWIGTTKDIRTGAGMFTRKVTVYTPGEYKAEFEDSNGYIGSVTFNVVSSAPTQEATTIPTTTAATATQAATTAATTVQTQATQSPLNPGVSLAAVACAVLASILAVKKR